MDIGITLLLTLIFGLMLFLIQRSEPKRRRLVALGMLVGGELIRRYVWYRSSHGEAWLPLIGRYSWYPGSHSEPWAALMGRYGWSMDIHAEAWVALITALVLNFLFWILIGRYNPVGSSDRIQVIGMDD